MADSTPKAAPSISLTAPLPSLKGTVPPTLKALIPFPDTTPSATPKASVMRASLLYHVVNLANGDYLNVHSGAGSKYPVVGRLAADTGNISSTGKTRKNGNTTWVFISAESISGWVNADFLQPGEAKVTPPSATATPMGHRAPTATPIRPVGGNRHDPRHAPRANNAEGP